MNKNGISYSLECQNNTNPEVTIDAGVVKGSVIMTAFGTEVEQFLGVPFALPPIGSRRFANPEPYGDYPGGRMWNKSTFNKMGNWLGKISDTMLSSEVHHEKDADNFLKLQTFI